MDQRKLGIFLFLLGIALAGLFYRGKLDSEQQIQALIAATGDEEACFLEDGTCLHQEQSKTFLIGEACALLIFALGVYLFLFDKTKELFALQAEQNVKIASALKQAEEVKKKDVAFQAFLAGFDEDQQKVLKAIKEQDGILQSTLRYRTGLTKTDVSLILKEFEEKKYITKKPEGNTNKIFLRKMF